MNKIILQLWEITHIVTGITADGCSLHLNVESRNEYIKKHLDGLKNTPPIYERPIGDCIEVMVDDNKYRTVKKNKFVRLQQNQLNNLISLKEFKFE